jgi:hypothetical protein
VEFTRGAAERIDDVSSTADEEEIIPSQLTAMTTAVSVTQSRLVGGAGNAKIPKENTPRHPNLAKRGYFEVPGTPERMDLDGNGQGGSLAAGMGEALGGGPSTPKVNVSAVSHDVYVGFDSD